MATSLSLWASFQTNWEPNGGLLIMSRVGFVRGRHELEGANERYRFTLGAIHKE